MNITKTTVHKLDSGNVLALASITINDEFVVSGLRVLNGKNGLWVSMPSRKDKNGEYHDIAFPCTKEARTSIQDSVLAKFHEQDDVSFNDKDSEDIYNELKEKSNE